MCVINLFLSFKSCMLVEMQPYQNEAKWYSESNEFKMKDPGQFNPLCHKIKKKNKVCKPQAQTEN